MDFGRVLEANMASKIDKNRENLWYNDFSKTRISRGLFVEIKVSGSQKSVKIDKNRKTNPTKIASRFSMPLGGQHGTQNPPKTPPKSMKNRWKIDSKIDENFECILSGLLVALGANMAAEPPKNRPQGVLLFSVCGILGSLGGLLRPLGAQEQMLSICHRCLSDFYWFLVDVWPMFGRFFIDFWAFFDW